MDGKTTDKKTNNLPINKDAADKLKKPVPKTVKPGSDY